MTARRPLSPEVLDRMPPSDLQAERNLLGAMLWLPACCDDVALVVRSEDFYADANQRLYRHLLAMRDIGQPIDVTLLVDRLKAAGDLEAVGGVAYLRECLAVSQPAIAVYYAKVVAKHAQYRALIHAGCELLRDAYEAAGEPRELAATAEAALLKIGTPSEETHVRTAKEAALEATDVIEQTFERKTSAGYMTGLFVFDQSTGGLFGGELTVLAARPRIGKTALAAQIANHGAQRGRLVYFVSLEMAGVELALRILCGDAEVSIQTIRRAELKPGDVSRLCEAANKFAQGNLIFDARPRHSVSSIRHAVRRQARHGLALIVVDCLGRVQPKDTRAQRYEQVGQITRGLKELATELNVPVLLLAHLGREAEKEPRPSLRHLRESGDIENDADNVLFISGEPLDRNKTLILEKVRQGEAGDIPLLWFPERTRFECAEDNGTVQRPPDLPRRKAKPTKTDHPAANDFNDFRGDNRDDF